MAATLLYDPGEPGRRSRACVERLAAVPSECEIDAIERAIARMDHDDAFARTIARVMNRRPIPAELMAAQFPWCDLVFGPALVALAEGERGARLVELAEHGRFPEDRKGAGLRALALHAAWLLDGEVLRERITTQLHRLVTRWRMQSGAYHSELAGELARVLGEASIARGYDGSVEPDVLGILRWALSTTRAHVLQTTLEALPAEHTDAVKKRRPAIVLAGPKVGRNEPCPCGSGKKYKRCHGGMEHDGAVTPEHDVSLTPSTLTADEILAMPSGQAGLIELSALADDLLRVLLARFLDDQTWEFAEAVLVELARRPSVEHERLDRYRTNMIERAVACHRLEVAHRHVAHLIDVERTAVDPLVSSAIALRLRSADLGERLLAAAESTVKDDTGVRARVFAHQLLFSAPALGVLVTRGCLPADDWQAKVLLNMTEEARARLGLPPGDLTARIHAGFQYEREARDARSEAEGLRSTLQEATRRIRELEQRGRDLDAQHRERHTAASGKADSIGAPDPAEVRALRDKIETLQARIREGNEERAALRRQLAATGTEPDGNDSAASNGSTEPTSDNLDEEVPADTSPRRILIPRWSRPAEEGLQTVPTHVAGEALRTVADLAAGDDAAWRAVKRPKGIARPVLMVRIGIHHRLIFDIESNGLDVVELVTRSALDVTLKRLRAT